MRQSWKEPSFWKREGKQIVWKEPLETRKTPSLPPCLEVCGRKIEAPLEEAVSSQHKNEGNDAKRLRIWGGEELLTVPESSVRISGAWKKCKVRPKSRQHIRQFKD